MFCARRVTAGPRWSLTPAAGKSFLYGEDRERGDLRD